MKVDETYTDGELVAAISQDRDLNKAILFLYRQYAGMVSSFLMGQGADRTDAEDVFQETVIAFINIVKKGNYRMEAKVGTFLVAIARNTWLNELKKNERSGYREKEFENNRGQEEADISQYIIERETKKQLRDLLYRLDEPCRKILLLFYYENLSMKEITHHLPYENEQVVRNKKYKCLQYLTGLVKKHSLIAGLVNSKK
jgi:RNA polymerase sigma factor (sigma-70 family)